MYIKICNVSINQSAGLLGRPMVNQEVNNKQTLKKMLGVCYWVIH